MPTTARRWPRTRRWTSTTSSCARWNCSSATQTSAHAGRRNARTCSSTNTRTPIPRNTGCCARWSVRRRRSPRWGTTTRRSTAGAARPSTTSQACPSDHPELKVVKLEQNYRSTVRILRCANALIANNPKLFEKRLWSERGMGDAIRVVPAADDEAEAEMVVRRLSAMKFELRAKFSDFAILYRGNHQARAFETALRGAEHAVRRVGRPVAFRQGRGEGHRRVPSAHRQRRRRSGVRARRDMPEARHRTGDAQASGRNRRRSPRESFRRRVSRRSWRRPFRPGSTKPSREFCALINNLRFRAEREPAGRLLNELYAATRLRGMARGDAGQARGQSADAKRARPDRLAVAQGRERRSQPARADADGRADHDARGPRRRGRRCRAPVDAARGEGARVSARLSGGPGGRAPAPPRIGGARDDRRGAPAHVRRHDARAADAAPVVLPAAQARRRA